jgi:hypothetical protein
MTKPKKARQKNQRNNEGPQNVISLPFDKAIEGLLSVKPKKKPSKRKKKPSK